MSGLILLCLLGAATVAMATSATKSSAGDVVNPRRFSFFLLENRGSSLVARGKDVLDGLVLAHTDLLHLQNKVLENLWTLVPVENDEGLSNDKKRVNICRRDLGWGGRSSRRKGGRRRRWRWAPPRLCLGARRPGDRVGLVPRQAAAAFAVTEVEDSDPAEPFPAKRVTFESRLDGGHGGDAIVFLCSRMAKNDFGRTELAAFLQGSFSPKRCSFKMLPFA